MKRLIITIIMILICCTNYSNFQVIADNRYARIEKTTEIFKTNYANKNIDNIICLAEESYYVEIIADYDSLYKVNYNGITGYIKKTDIRKVENIPNTPFPNNIKIIMNSNCNLRNSPTTKSSTNNIISTINTNAQDIIFIGRTTGEEAIDFGGTTWYYVNYNGNYGYIYNNYIKSITPIYKNTDKFTYLQEYAIQNENPLSQTSNIIIIIALSIPLFCILFILYIPRKHNQHKKKKHKSLKEIERY